MYVSSLSLNIAARPVEEITYFIRVNDEYVKSLKCLSEWCNTAMIAVSVLIDDHRKAHHTGHGQETETCDFIGDCKTIQKKLNAWHWKAENGWRMKFECSHGLFSTRNDRDVVNKAYDMRHKQTEAPVVDQVFLDYVAAMKGNSAKYDEAMKTFNDNVLAVSKLGCACDSVLFPAGMPFDAFVAAAPATA
jgi:hypothetical protein